jgi:hypothetical protein
LQHNYDKSTSADGTLHQLCFTCACSCSFLCPHTFALDSSSSSFVLYGCFTTLHSQTNRITPPQPDNIYEYTNYTNAATNSPASSYVS